jgi:predicted dehydrogenase
LTTALKFTKLGLPVFIEKPLSHNLNGLEQLKGKILVGYCLRFDESLRKFKKTVPSQGIQSVKIVCQTWLPDWHPQTDYRQSYSAKKELGGGVLLDLSHEIDYALWFFGPVKKVAARLQKAPELAIETEAVADLNLEFVSGVKAEIHLSYASRHPARFCEIKTKDQTFRWDFQPNNDMYIEEMKHFIKVVKGQEKPLVTVADGIKVLKIIETARINRT